MKLLHDVVLLCATRVRRATGRGTTARTFHVTVPASLANSVASDSTALSRSSAKLPMRREPASFLKSPRHLRLRSPR